MDKILISEIKKLKQEISPRSEWVALNRDFLLQQINPTRALEAQPVGVGGYVELFNQMFRRQLMQPAVMMLLVLGVFLGSSLTINAAFYSLPGDGLYPVKLALEKTHAALVIDESQQVELKIEFAQKRVDELSKVIAQVDSSDSKKRKIEAVAKEFTDNVSSLNGHLVKIIDSGKADGSSANSVRMALTISLKTGELAKTFNQTVKDLTPAEKDDVKDVVDQAIQSAQDTSTAAHNIATGSGEVKGAAVDTSTTTSTIPIINTTVTVNQTTTVELVVPTSTTTQPSATGGFQLDTTKKPVE